MHANPSSNAASSHTQHIQMMLRRPDKRTTTESLHCMRQRWRWLLDWTECSTTVDLLPDNVDNDHNKLSNGRTSVGSAADELA